MKSGSNLEMSSVASKKIIIIIFILVIVTMMCVFIFIFIPEYYEKKQGEYNSIVEEYNIKVGVMNHVYDEATQRNITINVNIPSMRELNNKTLCDYVKQGGNPFELSLEIKKIQAELEDIQSKYEKTCQEVYNNILSDYNVMATAYNELVQLTSIEYINDLPSAVPSKNPHTIHFDESYTDDAFMDDLDSLIEETDMLISEYILVEQITNPDEGWVLERLQSVDSIKEAAAVTESNDPNGFLGKDGGYTSCIYFTIKLIDENTVHGNDVIEKGTDAGGAVEVYVTSEQAFNRCDYLSQFDGSELVSGSYTIIGTMVVRTSYMLSADEQMTLTDEITKAFTEVK